MSNDILGKILDDAQRSLRDGSWRDMIPPQRQKEQLQPKRKWSFGLFLNPLKQYAVFKGRACRKEFWSFVIFAAIIRIVLIAATHNNIGILIFYDAVMLVPLLAVSVRRLHDTGNSGWKLFSYNVVNEVGWRGKRRFKWIRLGIGILLLILFFNKGLGTNGWLAFIGMVLLLFLCTSFMNFLALMCHAGNLRENQYGPEPNR